MIVVMHLTVMWTSAQVLVLQRLAGIPEVYNHPT